MARAILRGKHAIVFAGLAFAIASLGSGCIQPGSLVDEEAYRIGEPAPLPEASTDSGADCCGPEASTDGTTPPPDTAPPGDTNPPPMDTNPPNPDAPPPTTVTIWIEAESATLSAPVVTTDDASASGGKYISAPTATKNDTPDATPSGIVDYQFSVTEQATFTVFGRVRAPSIDSDSYWVKMDQGPWLQWNNLDMTVNWLWDDIHDTVQGDTTIRFPLSPGSHTLRVCYREPGTGLDKLVISNDPTFVPNGLGQ